MKRGWFWLRLALTAILLAWAVRSVDLSATSQALRGAHLTLLAVAVAIALLDRATMIVKWLPLLRVQVPGYPWRPAARTYMASTFAGLFMPSVASDTLRGVALGRGRGAVPEIGAAILVERVLGMLGGAVLCGVALLLALNGPLESRGLVPWAWTALLVPPGLCLAAWAVSRLLRSRSGFPGAALVHRFRKALTIYGGHRGTVLGVAAASVLEQGITLAMYLAIAAALETSIEPGMLWVTVPLMLFAARIPLTFWGLGVAEGGMIFLLSFYGVAPAESLALVLVGRVVELIVILPGGLLWSDLLRRDL